jgi:hypothetical protein
MRQGAPGTSDNRLRCTVKGEVLTRDSSGAQHLRTAEHAELRESDLLYGARTLSQTRSEQQRQLHARHRRVHR